MTTRARPELDPLGARVGSFLFFPTLGVAEKYDDNIYSYETGEVDDTITVVNPEFQLRSDWNNHALKFFAGAEAGYYADHDTEDYVDYFTGADTRLDFTRNSRLEASATYSSLHEDRGYPEESGLEPTEYRLFRADANFYQNFNRLSLGLGGGLSRFNFEDGIRPDPLNPTLPDPVDPIITNADRNRDEWAGTLRLGYEVSPRLEVFARGTRYQVVYVQKVDDAGRYRDSIGYEAVLGTAFDVTGVTFGELFAGYRAQDPTDPQFDSIKFPQYGGSITWNPSGLTTVKGDITRGFKETTHVYTPGYVATRYGLGVDHELLRNLLLGLKGSYATWDYQEITREDRYVTGEFYSTYLMNRHLYITLDYHYRDRRSNVLGQDYVNNVFMLRLQTQY